MTSMQILAGGECGSHGMAWSRDMIPRYIRYSELLKRIYSVVTGYYVWLSATDKLT